MVIIQLPHIKCFDSKAKPVHEVNSRHINFAQNQIAKANFAEANFQYSEVKRISLKREKIAKRIRYLKKRKRIKANGPKISGREAKRIRFASLFAIANFAQRIYMPAFDASFFIFALNFEICFRISRIFFFNLIKIKTRILDS